MNGRELMLLLWRRVTRSPRYNISCEFVEAGGLLSAGFPNSTIGGARRVCGSHRQGREAERPPMRAPVRFELVINLNTAKALGPTIPHSMLMLADEVIE